MLHVQDKQQTNRQTVCLNIFLFILGIKFFCFCVASTNTEWHFPPKKIFANIANPKCCPSKMNKKITNDEENSSLNKKEKLLLVVRCCSCCCHFCSFSCCLGFVAVVFGLMVVEFHCCLLML